MSCLLVNVLIWVVTLERSYNIVNNVCINNIVWFDRVFLMKNLESSCHFQASKTKYETTIMCIHHSKCLSLKRKEYHWLKLINIRIVPYSHKCISF